MIINIFLFTLGLVLIVVGGNLFVDSAIWISEKLRVPKFIIGATVVSVATTLPELSVSLIATLGGKYEIAAGNAIGSVVANIGLILAISIIVMPCEIKKQRQLFKSALLLAAAIVTLVFGINGSLNILPSVLLLLIWITFMGINLYDGKKAEELAPSLHTPVLAKEIVLTLVKFGLGIGMLVCGSNLLVTQGCNIARTLKISESVIAVTIVAVGTSLPELVTTVTALIKKQPSLSVGNILGANIMDIAFIMPICVFASGELIIKSQTLMLDLPMCIILTLLAFVYPAAKKKYTRIIGIIALALYAAYIAALLI